MPRLRFVSVVCCLLAVQVSAAQKVATVVKCITRKVCHRSKGLNSRLHLTYVGPLNHGFLELVLPARCVGMLSTLCFVAVTSWSPLRLTPIILLNLGLSFCPGSLPLHSLIHTEHAGAHRWLLECAVQFYLFRGNGFLSQAEVTCVCFSNVCFPMLLIYITSFEPDENLREYAALFLTQRQPRI